METLVRPHIRWMISRDMPQVLAIERLCFSEPWGEDEFLRMRRQRNCIGMVAEEDNEVVGYMIYMLHKSKLALHNIAVRPARWDEGIGRLLVDKLKGKLGRRVRIETMVRGRNLHAQVFFRAMGFVGKSMAADDDTEAIEFAYDYRKEEA